MVRKLLALGAKPEIDFDSWVMTYLAQNTHARNFTPEQTRPQYENSTTQPIIAAAIKNLGQTVQDLLDFGANPKVLEKKSYNIVRNPRHSSYRVGQSVLDIIQAELKLLKDWKPMDMSKKPETLRVESTYTRGLKAYPYWSAQMNFLARKRENEQAWDDWKKKTEIQEPGMEEKQAAIRRLITELEVAEEALIEAGSKTLAEMYPGLPKTQERISFNLFDRRNHPAVPYKTSLTFAVPELNHAKKDGYFRLFEAAWDNDLHTVKMMTLAPWQWKEGSPIELPLRVAIMDGNGFSPFSIAVLRGHYDLAKKIVDICMVQYHKDDGLTSRQRWTMRTGDSDDEYDSDGDYHNNRVFPIYSEFVNDRFTVDNLGEVSNIVKSIVLPSEMIEWTCVPQRFLDTPRNDLATRSTLLEHAVLSGNMELLKFIIGIGAEQKALTAEDDDDQTSYTISQSVFFAAIKKGRTSMLAEMIKATGVGIPLNALVQKIGVEIKTKSRLYQGLSVGGKKRADWAQAPGGELKVIEERVPPLLQAARFGSVESVEWFMSEAPLRRYNEFAEANKHDKRIKTLTDSKKGFEKIISSWMNAKSTYFLSGRTNHQGLYK
ncbi:hypothetical protein WAI453_001554 [Rhynchosporium graminicola]